MCGRACGIWGDWLRVHPRAPGAAPNGAPTGSPGAAPIDASADPGAGSKSPSVTPTWPAFRVELAERVEIPSHGHTAVALGELKSLSEAKSPTFRLARNTCGFDTAWPRSRMLRQGPAPADPPAHPRPRPRIPCATPRPPDTRSALMAGGPSRPVDPHARWALMPGGRAVRSPATSGTLGPQLRASSPTRRPCPGRSTSAT